MSKAYRRQTILLEEPPSIQAYASVAGKKESEGPLGGYFDLTSQDTRFGEKTWEKAENQMQKLALRTALNHADLTEADIDLAFSGDLLNQCIGSSFSLRDTGIPSLGLYGACSTMAESLLLAAMAVSGGFVSRTLAMTSSHFASSERQFRFPLGYGGQRTPTAQWTVTGAGCTILSRSGLSVYVRGGTVGCIQDLGIRDANNMGAAMAPAAIDTLTKHFLDLGKQPSDYDLIVTGDLGSIGRQIVLEQMQQRGYDLKKNYQDCGVMIFDASRQDVHAGGSGCGCSALVLCGYLLRQMEQQKLHNLLFCGTGALLSPISTNQGESVPGICHAVWLSTERS